MSTLMNGAEMLLDAPDLQKRFGCIGARLIHCR